MLDEKIVVDLKNYNGTTITAIRDGRCIYNNRPESYYLEKGYSILTWEELESIQEEYLNKLCNDWKEITEEQFEYALNVLPPVRWENGGFFMSERYTNDVTGYYQQIGDKYYTSLQRLSYNRENILENLNQFINKGK